MAITDGKCYGIIHVQERRQSRRERWRGGRRGTTWERGHDLGALRWGQWGSKDRNFGVEGRRGL